MSCIVAGNTGIDDLELSAEFHSHGSFQYIAPMDPRHVTFGIGSAEKNDPEMFRRLETLQSLCENNVTHCKEILSFDLLKFIDGMS